MCACCVWRRDASHLLAKAAASGPIWLSERPGRSVVVPISPGRHRYYQKRKSIAGRPREKSLNLIRKNGLTV